MRRPIYCFVPSGRKRIVLGPAKPRRGKPEVRRVQRERRLMRRPWTCALPAIPAFISEDPRFPGELANVADERLLLFMPACRTGRELYFARRVISRVRVSRVITRDWSANKTSHRLGPARKSVRQTRFPVVWKNRSLSRYRTA